jgi:hypothetical protein
MSRHSAKSAGRSVKATRGSAAKTAKKTAKSARGPVKKAATSARGNVKRARSATAAVGAAVKTTAKSVAAKMVAPKVEAPVIVAPEPMPIIRTPSPPMQPVAAPAFARSAHKYQVGETVYYTSPSFGRAAATGSYTVVKLLPSEGDDYQYRIKSSGEAFERVAKESQLERA